MPKPKEYELNSLNVASLGFKASELLTELVAYQKDYTQYLADMRLYNNYKGRYPRLTSPIRTITLSEIRSKQTEVNKIRRLLGRATVNILAEIREYKRELYGRDDI